MAKKCKIGVIGYPISHSLSPRIHNYWLRERGIEAIYEAIPIKPEALVEFLQNMQDENFIGVNVTIPHKEAVFALLKHGLPGIRSETRQQAKYLGAINTVAVKENALTGLNTDVYGFSQSLLRKYSKAKLKKICRNVLIIGAGGAARAVCGALKDYAGHITLVNRTQEKAILLMQHMDTALGMNITVSGWNKLEHALKNVTLLVNTSSLGMKGQPPLILSLDSLSESATVIDIVYNPLPTALLAAAARRGNAVIDGLDMLLYQAQGAFAEWFDGPLPEVTPELRDYIAEALA